MGQIFTIIKVKWHRREQVNVRHFSLKQVVLICPWKFIKRLSLLVVFCQSKINKIRCLSTLTNNHYTHSPAQSLNSSSHNAVQSPRSI